MAIEVTPEDVRALNERIVVARYVPMKRGSGFEGEHVYVKGLLSEILDYFIPEGSMVINFSEDAPKTPTK